MNSICGETITVSADGQIVLMFEFYSNTQFYDGNCSVTITSEDKTMMYFSRFDVSCEDGHLSVTEAFTNVVIHGNVKAYELLKICLITWLDIQTQMQSLTQINKGIDSVMLCKIKLMNGKALRKHSLHEKTRKM